MKFIGINSKKKFSISQFSMKSTISLDDDCRRELKSKKSGTSGWNEENYKLHRWNEMEKYLS